MRFPNRAKHNNITNLAQYYTNLIHETPQNNKQTTNSRATSKYSAKTLKICNELVKTSKYSSRILFYLFNNTVKIVSQNLSFYSICRLLLLPSTFHLFLLLQKLLLLPVFLLSFISIRSYYIICYSISISSLCYNCLLFSSLRASFPCL